MSGYLLKFKQTYSVKIGGRRYPVVKIGNQLWTTLNLDYKFEGLAIGASTNYSVPRAAYYKNDESTYGWDATGIRKQYGLLYNWTAAKYLDDNRSTLLPDGWRVPSFEDFQDLINEVGTNSSTKLKSADGWSNTTYAGTDDYGFSAVPTGLWNQAFDGVGSGAYMWSTTQYTSSQGRRVRFYQNKSEVDSFIHDKSTFQSIRLVKSLT